MKQTLARFLRALPLLLLAPFLLLIAALALALADLIALFVPRIPHSNRKPSTRAASLVIPNWNGRDLLEKFLPSWLAAIESHPGSEVLVVDNGSTDGSADWIRVNYPQIHLLALDRNLGFGGGSNAGFRAAANDIVVLLNSDMRVEPDFLGPLLGGFTDESVFAVSCQIFLGDKSKRREETGLTEGWWQDGGLRVSHREDPEVDTLFPCFYGGGGSCAFDRAKFLELGGFDELLAPFYLEDTDIGFQAWKRGWKVLYQPASIVHHEHRGTIGKKFSPAYIQSVLRKNYALFCWKNIHEWRRLASHLFGSFGGAVLTALYGDSSTRASAPGIARAFLHLPAAMRSRIRARRLASISDSEAFRRSRPAYFHDRFGHFQPNPARPRVLFVSPYPICPPVHGGGVFMYGAIRELSRHADVHAIVMLDYEKDLEPNRDLLRYCRTAEFLVRRNKRSAHPASIEPHAAWEFQDPDFEWLIQREALRHSIDVIQLEYTPLAQYARRFDRIVCALFEHDVYFQSIARALPFMRSPLERTRARFEYLRALRFETRSLAPCDEIQVCTEENRRYLASFIPKLAPHIDSGLRAGIDVSQYDFPGGPREPFTMLFLGSFRHVPNQIAISWFTREVLPLVLERIPQAKLIIAGSDPPPPHAIPYLPGAIELAGFVEDIRPLFSRCALFVCPIRSGSGIRVKLLEAFASGIPVVSTRIGAEGLARQDGEFCALADDPRAFADHVIGLLNDPARAIALAARARRHVESEWDMRAVIGRLVARYKELLAEKRGSSH